MLDKSYVRALRKGDVITVRCRRGADLTTAPVGLTLRKEAAGDFRIFSESLNCDGRGEDIYAAFEDLGRQLLARDLIPCCCGYCWYLQFTGMSRQMSSGEKGYCLLYATDHGRSLTDVVGIFDYCDFFKGGPQGLAKERDRNFQEKG